MNTKTYKPLDDLIEKSGLKLWFIADELGVSRQRLHDIRMDPSTMSIDQMEKLAVILNVGFMDVYGIYKNFKEEVDKNTTD